MLISYKCIILLILQYSTIWYILTKGLQFMNWDIQFTNKSTRQARELDEQILLSLQLLVNDLRFKGAYTWKELAQLWKVTRPKTRRQASLSLS